MTSDGYIVNTIFLVTHSYAEHKSAVHSIAFNSGAIAATASSDHTIKVLLLSWIYTHLFSDEISVFYKINNHILK